MFRSGLVNLEKQIIFYSFENNHDYAIDADIYIVGVCLGAQLLSVAYGGKYEHSPEREIGVFPLTLTDEGLADEHTLKILVLL